METSRRAVIDVGTNSIKLLVAEVVGREVRPIHEVSKQTRLGEGFYDTHQLQPGPIAKTARAVADFAEVARKYQAKTIRVIATSAARDAVNAAALTSAIEQASGVTTDPVLAREPLLLLDVGGGSTECILGVGEEKHFRQSLPLGTVRLLERLSPADPPSPEELAGCRRWIREFLQTKVKPSLASALQKEMKVDAGPRPVQLIGTGGTASILGCMEAQLDHFDRQRLEPPNRADVILTGTAIYEGVLEQFGFGELRISTRGLRFAALMG